MHRTVYSAIEMTYVLRNSSDQKIKSTSSQIWRILSNLSEQCSVSHQKWTRTSLIHAKAAKERFEFFTSIAVYSMMDDDGVILLLLVSTTSHGTCLASADTSRLCWSR
jgi:hypothetical protein